MSKANFVVLVEAVERVQCTVLSTFPAESHLLRVVGSLIQSLSPTNLYASGGGSGMQ